MSKIRYGLTGLIADWVKNTGNMVSRPTRSTREFDLSLQPGIVLSIYMGMSSRLVDFVGPLTIALD